MSDLILNALTFAGSLGLFIYGMKVMSEGIQRAAGASLRAFLHALTRHRIAGLFNGFFITSILQSSSAVTVLTVGLVNAGLLTVLESMAFVMGANIGTTITGWIVSVLGFRVKLQVLSLPLIAIALPLLFIRGGKWSFYGQTLIGLALLFLGLQFLQGSFPDLSSQPALLEFLRKFSGLGFLSVLLYILAGALLTGVVQSSSALVAVVLVMSANGWLSFPHGAAMVLGANIGTTVTANLAAVVGNTYARRSALFHFLFNVIGVLWMIPVLPWFLRGTDWLCRTAFLSESAFLSADAIPLALSAFHTAFNTANAFLLLFFVPLLHRLLVVLLPVKSEELPVFKLAWLDTSVSTADLALFEVQKAVGRMGKTASGMLPALRHFFRTTDPDEQAEGLARLRDAEALTDRMEAEILEFLEKMSVRELSREVSVRVSLYQRIGRELERIADVIYGIGRTLDKKNQDRIWFTPLQRERLSRLLELVEQSLQLMEKHLHLSEGESPTLAQARDIEDRIDEWRHFVREEHLANSQDEEYHIAAGLIFNQIITSLERVGDHAYNITVALSDPYHQTGI